MYDQDQIAKPKFDPSKTFTPVDDKPAFNPNASFSDASLPVKKKDVGGNGTSNGNGQQSSDDPVKQILQPLRDDYGNKLTNYLQVKNISSGDVQTMKQPFLPQFHDAFYQTQEPTSQVTQAKEQHNQAANKLSIVQNQIKNNIVPNGKVAKKKLADISSKGQLNPDNETQQLLSEKSNEYDKVYSDFLKTNSIVSSAVNEAMEEDPHFADQVKAMNGKVDPLLLGQITKNYITKHQGDLEELSNEDRNIGTEYENLRDNFPNVFPAEGKVDIANKISKERTKLGYNSIIGNFNTHTFSQHNSDIASKTLTPNEQEFYKKNKDDIDGMINTGGVLNNISQGTQESLLGMGGSLSDILGRTNKATHIQEQFDKQASQVSNGEQGWKSGVGNMFHMAGTLLPIMAGGEIGEGLGLTKAAASGSALTAAFGHNLLSEAEAKYPTNQNKAALSFLSNIIAYNVLPDIAPAGKVKDVFNSVKEPIEKAVENIGENETLNSIRAKIGNAFNAGLKQYGKGIGEMGGLGLYNNLFDKLAMNDDSFKKYHSDTDVGDIVKDMATANVIPGILGGVGELTKSKQELPNEQPQPEQQPQEPTAGGNVVEQPTGESENIHPNENYRTMDMGNDEGKDETKEARTQMKERFSNGDVPIDGENGKGETGKQFAARALSQWIDDKNNQPNNTTIVTHSSVLKAIKAYEDMKDKPEDVNNFSPEQWKEFSDNYNKESTENGDLETFKGTNGDIHVIRHGQTVDNEENKFRSGDTNLTDKGIKQAKVSGQELKEKTGGNVPKIITSDLPRAIHSSNLIHSELTGEKPRIRVSAEQLEAAQPKGESEVPQQNKVVEGTTEGEGGKRTGISHKSLSDLADRIGLPKPQEGSYMPLAWYRDRGRKLLDVGADIKQLETDFKNGKQPSADDISVATAHTDDLENIANSMGDKWGMDSNQYKDAKTELNRFKDEVAKPMGTKAGEAFYSLQSLGERNTDTGSHTSLSSAFEEDNKKAPNAKQSQELKDISDKYTQLKKDFDDLRNGISNGGKVKASLADQARSFAKDLRSGDKNILPAWLRADLPKGTKTSGFTLNEAFAKALETFADIHDKTKDFAQAIDAAVKHLSKWFEENNVKYNENDLRKNLENEVTSQFPEAKNIKKLKKELDDLQNGIAKQKNPKRELTEREKELKEQIKDEKEKLGLVKSKAQKPLTEQEQIDEDKKAQEQKEKTKTDLQNRFVNKTDNKFEPKDAKDVWNYINNKLDGGTDFDNAVQESAADLGLSVEQVQNAIASDKTIKSTTDKLYKNQRERSKLKRDAEYYIKAAGDKKGIKILRALTAIPRGLKIFGHGTVPMETHAGMSKFDVDPESAKIYYKNLAKTYRLYGSSIYYEKAVQMYKSDPTYHLFNAMGLAGDFGKTYEDYLLPNTWWKGTPVGKLQEASKRGFDILKFHRHDLMKMHYNKLSAEEKQDPELLKTYADIVNHQTGNVKPIFRPESTVGKVAEHSFFALKLEGSRWAGITDVGKAIATLMDKDASKADKVRAKMVTWRAARLMGAYMGALALNQGLLSATGSNQKINGIPKFLGGAGIDLSKSDFLDMKMFGKHFGVVGGMSGVIRFIGNLIRAPFESKQQLHGKSVLGTWEDLGTSYLRGKASPLAGDVIDVGTHHDAQGNTLPFFNDKPLHHYNHKLSVGEYISKFSPIPIEGAVNNIKDEMENNGVKKADAETILKGISSGVMEGATGIRIGEDFSKNGTKNGLGGGGSSGTYMTVKNPTTFKERPATDDEIKKVNQTVEKNLPTALDKFKNNATKIWVDVNDKIHTSKIGGNETEREKGTWEAVKYDDLTDDQKSQLEKKVKDKVSKEAEKQLKY